MRNCPCFSGGKSEEVDENGLMLQPMTVALSSRVQLPNMPPLLLPVELGEVLLARVSFFVCKDLMENLRWQIVKFRKSQSTIRRLFIKRLPLIRQMQLL